MSYSSNENSLKLAAALEKNKIPGPLQHNILRFKARRNSSPNLYELNHHSQVAALEVYKADANINVFILPAATEASGSETL